MRTTLTLDEDIASQLRQLRKLRGVGLKALVNEALRAGESQDKRECKKPLDCSKGFGGLATDPP